jgi:hypothetical protein
VYFPKGDINQGRIVCEGDSAEPCKSLKAPFHLGIDQQDRIWVASSGVNHLTRFPASDPSKTENFKTGGFNSSGLAIDSQGNVWVTNRFGSGLLGMAHLVDMGVRLKAAGVEKASDYLTKIMSEQKGGKEGGSVVLLKPDGSQFPGSPFTGSSLPGPWAAAVDGDDNVCRIVVAFRSVSSGRYTHSCSAFGFLYQRFSSLLGEEASPFRDQQSSSTVVRCQPWFYWGLVAHSFFGLSEGD